MHDAYAAMWTLNFNTFGSFLDDHVRALATRTHKSIDQQLRTFIVLYPVGTAQIIGLSAKFIKVYADAFGGGLTVALIGLPCIPKTLPFVPLCHPHAVKHLCLLLGSCHWLGSEPNASGGFIHLQFC